MSKSNSNGNSTLSVGMVVKLSDGSTVQIVRIGSVKVAVETGAQRMRLAKGTFLKSVAEIVSKTERRQKTRCKFSFETARIVRQLLLDNGSDALAAKVEGGSFGETGQWTATGLTAREARLLKRLRVKAFELMELARS